MRKRAKELLPSRLTEDNIVELSICDRGNALKKMWVKDRSEDRGFTARLDKKSFMEIIYNQI
jgi:hypothetical protein